MNDNRCQKCACKTLILGVEGSSLLEFTIGIFSLWAAISSILCQIWGIIHDTKRLATWQPHCQLLRRDSTKAAEEPTCRRKVTGFRAREAGIEKPGPKSCFTELMNQNSKHNQNTYIQWKLMTMEVLKKCEIWLHRPPTGYIRVHVHITYLHIGWNFWVVKKHPVCSHDQSH